MDTNEWTDHIELVRGESLRLMNEGKGDGTIYECYDDEEIIAKFGGLTMAQAVEEVAKRDGLTKAYYDEIMATADIVEYEAPTARKTCDWMVQGYPTDAPEGWYPDFPSDLVRPCGAKVTILPNGWECEAGHAHYSDAEYYDDEEIAVLKKRGIALAPNARRMDGTPI